MSYQETEQARLKRQRSRQAIALAMQGRWREAVVANRGQIESFPNDVDAYNRLGRAYTELGEYAPAREAYHRAVELDPYNAIAQKNIRRLSYLREIAVGLEVDSNRVEPRQFIEEIGKAGVVSLYRLTSPETLARMVAGDKIYLKKDGTSLVAENGRGEYLGQCDPKHGQQLIKLMEGGNKYTAAVISAAEDMMRIIIREIYQDPTQVGRLSFSAKEFDSLRPSISDRMFRQEVEHEEELEGGPGYTYVDGGGEEVSLNESLDTEEQADNEE